MRTLSLLSTLICGGLLLAGAAGAQEVYRVVDENGNVTYTDQKPSDDAQPMQLPELNVLEGDLETGVDPLSEAERPALDFRIEQPASGTAITPEAGMLDVRMAIGIEVPPTARITLVLDGQPLAPVRTLDASIPAPEPGEHSLFARLETPSGRVLGTTDPVRFTTVSPTGD
jgi:hypothetical protein